MSWDVVVRIGNSDSFAPISQGGPVLGVSFDRPGDPFLARESVLDKIADVLGSVPGNTACDLLRAAIVVYSADLLISRRYAADGWTRDINVYLPVTSLAVWQQAGPLLTKLLTFLSGDRWQFYFRESSAEQECYKKLPENLPEVVSLFSGGLDSLIGAIDLLSEGKKVALVSHHGGGSTPKFQNDLFKCLKDEYGEQVVPLQFYVLPPQVPRIDSDPDNEDTTRTRSFLFFVLGIAVADTLGTGIPLYVAENGLISLNVPLTPARLGSCSTRTTHPYYIALFRELLQALNLAHPLNLDYRFKTKGEMLRESKNQDLLRRTLPLSMSCAHPDNRRLENLPPGGHCGYCFPCIIRQAAVFESGIPDAAYDNDIFHLPPLSRSDKGKDLRAMEIALERFSQRGEEKAVFDVLSSGPISPDELSHYIGVYCRGMKEIAKFLRSNKDE
ncbi:MAG: Qat anti-phage system QueC-like protein QatC [Bacillota bacterium]